jgi:hypothetical protein
VTERAAGASAVIATVRILGVLWVGVVLVVGLLILQPTALAFYDAGSLALVIAILAAEIGLAGFAVVLSRRRASAACLLLASALLVPAVGGPLAVHEVIRHAGLSEPGWAPAGQRLTGYLSAVLGTLILLLLTAGAWLAKPHHPAPTP